MSGDYDYDSSDYDHLEQMELQEMVQDDVNELVRAARALLARIRERYGPGWDGDEDDQLEKALEPFKGVE